MRQCAEIQYAAGAREPDRALVGDDWAVLDVAAAVLAGEGCAVLRAESPPRSRSTWSSPTSSSR
jgi:hypothetical protein